MGNIAIIGAGYVGLVTGACLSEFGMNIVCVDKDLKKIEQLNNNQIPIFEPGLDRIVEKNILQNRLKFTSDIRQAVEESSVIFLCVGTPPMEDGSADISHILDVSKEISYYINEYKVVVIKSTAPVGTARKIDNIIKTVLAERNSESIVDVVSNPEFLREGSAIRDFMHPDRIIIGAESDKAVDIVKGIYNVLYLIDTPFVITNLETAEMIKYSSNCFLAMKISYMNEIANLCELVDADVYQVARAMGLDGRIGNKFLHPGPGYGGSCLPKDTRALIKIAQEHEYDFKILESVISVNKLQKMRVISKIEKHVGELKGKQIGILGLSFKPETDDIREAPSVFLISELLERGARIKVYDPAAMGNIKAQYHDNVIYCRDEYAVCKQSDCLVILTEWNQFRKLDIKKVKKYLKMPIFIDMRNIYNPEELRNLGFTYEGVGRR